MRSDAAVQCMNARRNRPRRKLDRPRWKLDRPSRRKPYRSWAVRLAAAALALAAGCGNRSPYAPRDERVVPSASPIAHVIAGDERISLIERDDRTFVFRYAGDPPAIPVGHIIVGAEAGGFVARVKKVRVEPGVLFVETEPASLTDAIVSGEIDTALVVGAASPEVGIAGTSSPGGARDASLCGDDTASLSGAGAASIPSGGNASDQASWRLLFLSSGVSPADGGLSLDGVTILGDDSGGRRSAIVITEGYISFNPTVDVGLTVRGGSIERFRFRIEGRSAMRCALSADIPDPLDLSGETPLASFGTVFVRLIDGVPVVVGVTLNVEVEYEVAGAYTGDCDLCCEIDGRAAVGVERRSGSWHDEGSADPSMSAAPLTCSAFADTDLRIRVRCTAELSIYGVSAGGLAVEEGVRLRADAPAPPIWAWRIEGLIGGSAAIDAGILDPDLAGYASTPLGYTEELAAGPFSTEAYVFVTAWGSEGTEDGGFLFPRGIAVDASKRCYVVDTEQHRVQVFGPDSSFLYAWGGRGGGEGQFSFPAGIAIDREGMIYVVDAENHRIQEFLPGGSFRTAWGAEGTGDGLFKDPQGIAVDDSGYVYVADCFNRRLQKFTGDGAFVTAWGGPADGEEFLSCPMGVAVDGGGTVFVSDCHRHRVEAFTGTGVHLFGWGGYGSGEGEFNCPIDVETDGEGNVYVVDYGNDRIQKFTPDGRFMTALGSTGTGDGMFDRPGGIAVAADGYLFIVDAGNRRVQCFAPKIR